MLVVVVVEYAMSQKGEKLHECDYVLKRHGKSHNENDVCSIIRPENFGVSPNTELVVEIDLPNSNDFEPVEFYASRYDTEAGFTIPTDVIEENDLLPGQTIKLKVYERHSELNSAFSDNPNVIDRCNVPSDSTNPDGISTHLTSADVSGYLDGKEKRLIFKNLKNGKKKSACVKEYSSTRNRFQFPSKVRNALDCEYDDLIEVIKPKSSSTGGERSMEEKVDVIYKMMVEMYELEVWE